MVLLLFCIDFLLLFVGQLLAMGPQCDTKEPIALPRIHGIVKSISFAKNVAYFYHI